MAIYRLGSKVPQVPPSAYVAPEAVVIGEVILGEGANIWPGAVIRGDNVLIRVGRDTNVQEGAVLHSDPGLPLVVGDGVSIGHQAMLHGCTVGDGSVWIADYRRGLLKLDPRSREVTPIKGHRNSESFRGLKGRAGRSGPGR